MANPLFGVHAGAENATADQMVELWQTIERLGYGWISLWDHFSSLTGPGSLLEAVSTQTALAKSTSRVRCGVFVYSVGYRHPAVLANAIASIDHYSHGRAEVGIGAGWDRREFDTYGIPFLPTRERVDQLEEGVQVLAGLLHGELRDFEGTYFQVHDAELAPPPVQERLPVWVGGGGEKRTLRIAAKYADGWDAPLMPADAWARKRRILSEHCEAVGRDPSTIRTSAHYAVAHDEASLKAQWRDITDQYRGVTLMGSDDQVLDGIQQFVEAGADQVVLSVSGGLAPEIVEWVASLLQLSGVIA
jgi:alkanesulfonate monooxygenase SsuD/methylene tetrahydromethanopterin reductase-like flavin-dependent oxidoreductase (luciferase family)